MPEYVYLKNSNGVPFKPVTDLAALNFTTADSGLYVVRTGGGTIGINYDYVVSRLFSAILEAGCCPCCCDCSSGGTQTIPVTSSLDAPSLSLSPSTPTTGTVQINASYPNEVVSKYYRSATASAWESFQGNYVTVATNGAYVFYGTTADQELSTPTAAVTVSNIDHTKPTINSMWMADRNGTIIPESATTVVTSGRVYASATDNLQLHTSAYMWKIGGDPAASSGWQYNSTRDYIDIASNTYVYVKARDAAGNWSDVSSYEVTKIGEVIIFPTLDVQVSDPVTPNLRKVTITVTSSETGLIIYWNRNGDAEWRLFSFPSGMDVYINDTYNFKATNAFGHEATASVVISNLTPLDEDTEQEPDI